jgi:hypothetical protein
MLDKIGRENLTKLINPRKEGRLTERGPGNSREMREGDKTR